MSKAMRKREFQNGVKTIVGRKWAGQFQVITVIVTPIAKQSIWVINSKLLCKRLATMFLGKKAHLLFAGGTKELTTMTKCSTLAIPSKMK